MKNHSTNNFNYWQKNLEEAISSYNFELMINALKYGASPDLLSSKHEQTTLTKNENLILHRVINYDRADLLDYFLFSPELSKNLSIHYDYPLFGKQPAFPYACMCGALKCIKYLLDNPKICNFFDFPNLAQKSLYYAVESGKPTVVDYILNHPKTKDFCNLNFNNFEAIKNGENRYKIRKDYTLIKHLILTQDISIAQEIVKITIMENASNVLKIRELNDSLNEKLSENILKHKKNKI